LRDRGVDRRDEVGIDHERRVDGIVRDAQRETVND